MFTGKHFIWLGISAAIIAIHIILNKKFKFSYKANLYALFVVALVSEVVKIMLNMETLVGPTFETSGTYLNYESLPFHLCSIQIIFILIVNIVSNEKIKRFILSFMLPSCLIGGIAAILIATDSARNSPIITCQYYLYHVAIVVFAIKIYNNGEFKLEMKDFFNCLKFILVIMFFALYINSWTYTDQMIATGKGQVNFMYVVSPPQQGLPFLNENHGWLVYICHYAFLIIFAIAGCYSKVLIDFFKNKFKKENLVN